MDDRLLHEAALLHANVCQAVADPTRIVLLYALSERDATVGELSATLGISQPATSRHLKVLRDRGLVRARRVGASVRYRLADRRVVEALDLLRSVLADTLSEHAALARRLP